MSLNDTSLIKAQELATAVETAAKAFNEAIEEASRAGLTVEVVAPTSSTSLVYQFQKVLVKVEMRRCLVESSGFQSL